MHGFVKETPGCGLVTLGRQQEVDRLALLVHRTVQILPDAFDQEAGLVHAPAPAHWALMRAKDFLKPRQKPDRPAVD